MALDKRTWVIILGGLAMVMLVSFISPVVSDTEAISGACVTGQPPSNLTVSVQLNQKGTYTTAIFRGGFGQALLKEIQMELTTPDGKTDSGVLNNNVGDFVVLKGSGCGDRVTGTAYFKNGMNYFIVNEEMQYIVGICPADYKPATDPCAAIAVSPSLKPDLVQEIPANKSVVIQANVDISTIEVQFRGGFGQNLIKILNVTRIGPDGSEETKRLGNQIGDELRFAGTNNCMDRIFADVSFTDGTSYHFYDEVIHISRL